MREGKDRWVLSEHVLNEVGVTVTKDLPSPRVESKAELEDYLKEHAKNYADREVFVRFKRSNRPERPRRRSHRRRPRH